MAETYPQVGDIFFAVGVLPKLKARPMPLHEAIVRVVVGQMLSSEAARTIYARLVEAADERALPGTWQLTEPVLRRCGLSRAKSRTIREFGEALRADATFLDSWKHMPADDVMGTIRSFWGMSNWTASIIALFYLGHEDVFPEGDGSLQRALRMIELSFRTSGARLDPDRARPFRSYLALYLWEALDSGILGPA